MKAAVVLLTVFLSLLAAPAAAQDDEGRQLFETSCASCHQPDGTGISGAFPPLAGNPQAQDPLRVEEVVREGLSGPLEVLGVSYDGQMPGFPDLTDEQVAAVAAYVSSLAGAPTPASTTAAPAPAEGDADRGEALFVGSVTLAAGGPACLACHSAANLAPTGNVTLGPDLTTLFARFGGVQGAAAALRNPPSPTMQPLFADSPLTDGELLDLTAFFATLADAPQAQGRDLLVVAGLGWLAALILLVALAVRGPKQAYVEKLRSNR